MIPGANFKMKSGISWWIFGPLLGLFMVTGFLTVRDSIVILALYIPLTAYISDITHYKYTNNPISSPAVSLKRLALYHNGRILVIISPENRDLFVEVLKQHNTSLQQK